MKENNQKTTSHIVTLDNRKKIMLTAIEEVLSATDKTIIAKTINENLIINGNNLRVEKLVPEEKLLVVVGEIDQLKYSNKQATKSFFKRIFS